MEGMIIEISETMTLTRIVLHLQNAVSATQRERGREGERNVRSLAGKNRLYSM